MKYTGSRRRKSKGRGEKKEEGEGDAECVEDKMTVSQVKDEGVRRESSGDPAFVVKEGGKGMAV